MSNRGRGRFGGRGSHGGRGSGGTLGKGNDSDHNSGQKRNDTVDMKFVP